MAPQNQRPNEPCLVNQLIKLRDRWNDVAREFTDEAVPFLLTWHQRHFSGCGTAEPESLIASVLKCFLTSDGLSACESAGVGIVVFLQRSLSERSGQDARPSTPVDDLSADLAVLGKTRAEWFRDLRSAFDPWQAKSRAFYRSYYPPVMARLRAKWRSTKRLSKTKKGENPNPEDAVQEAFMEFFQKNMDRFAKHPIPLKDYLFNIAAKRCSDWYHRDQSQERKKKARKQQLESRVESVSVDQSEHYAWKDGEPLLNHPLVERFAEIIEEADREIFFLFVAGEKGCDIAQQINRSNSFVSGKRKYLFQRFQDFIIKSGETDLST